MTDVRKYIDDKPVPAVADRCPRVVKAVDAKYAKGIHLCKLHKDHTEDKTKHECICGLEWDHSNSTPAKDI